MILRAFNFLLLLLLSTSLLGQKNPYVLVLGIAQDAGYPQAECYKPCCLAAKSRDEIFVTSLAVVDPAEKKYWLLEASPDIGPQLRSCKEKLGEDFSFSGVFLTHAHIGHYTGLMHFGREAMGASNIPVYCMPKMQNFLKNNGPWSQLVDLNNILLSDIKGGVEISKNIKISAMQVPHRDEFSETVGYQISGPKKKLIFIPDIDKWTKWDTDIVDLARKNDHLLLDGTFYDNNELPGRDMSEIPHPFVIESMERFKDLSNEEKSKINFIHLNHTNKLLDNNSNEYKEVIKKGFGVAEQLQEFEI